MAQPQTILRLPAVLRETGTSRATIYNRIAEGLFVKSCRLGKRSVGWPAADVAAVNAARIAGASDEEIRRVVNALHDARAQGYTGGRAVDPNENPTLVARRADFWARVRGGEALAPRDKRRKSGAIA